MMNIYLKDLRRIFFEDESLEKLKDTFEEWDVDKINFKICFSDNVLNKVTSGLLINFNSLCKAISKISDETCSEMQKNQNVLYKLYIENMYIFCSLENDNELYIHLASLSDIKII